MAVTLGHDGDVYSCDHFVEPDHLLGTSPRRRWGTWSDCRNHPCPCNSGNSGNKYKKYKKCHGADAIGHGADLES